MSAASRSSSTKPSRIPACTRCHLQKVRCDRNCPCSNCIKANAFCVPSGPPPPRKRRRPNVELQARLARCEQLLKEYSNAKADQSEPETDSKSSPLPAYQCPDLDWKSTGKLVVEDGAMRFTDSFLWANVYEEVRAMRAVMEEDHSPDERSEWCPLSLTPDHTEHLLLGWGAHSLADRLEELQPSPSQIFRLWQVFLDRVNPLTKVIHAPTLQPYVADATSRTSCIPKSVEALLFSIYTMAIVSLTEEECLDILGCSAPEAFQRFSTGLRLSLIRVEFLKSHDFVILQALVLYLLSVQGRFSSRGTWVLNGVCIRIAQQMGLHRDGELLGLSPFDTEMRRRVWWQIIMLDAKCAMSSGLSPSLLPRSGDCKMPTNMNDADLLPAAMDYFQDRSGPTEMIICLLICKMGEFLLRLPGFQETLFYNEVGAVGLGLPSREQSAKFQELRQTVEDSLDSIIERYSDPSGGPIHELAIQTKLAITSKMRSIAQPPGQQPEWDSDMTTPKENIFRLSISAIEHSVGIYRSVKYKGFLWFMKMHFQYNDFLYMVGQLCHQTSGTLVERAWKQLPEVYHYHQELFDTSHRSSVTSSAFVLRAWRVRQGIKLAENGHAPADPEYIQRLRGKMCLEVNGDDPGLNMSSQFTRPQGNDVETSCEYPFSTFPDITIPDWSMWTTPEHAYVDPHILSFGEFGFRR